MRWRNRSKSLRQLIIDLTPLLDVIFILLIVVLCDQDSFIADAKDAAEQVSQQEQALETERETWQERLDAYEKQYSYMNVVNIHVTPSENDRKHRTVYISMGSEKPQTWELDPGRENQVWQKCKEHIENNLSDKSDRITIINIENSTMLYRDYEMVKGDFFESLDIQKKFLTDCMVFDDE